MRFCENPCLGQLAHRLARCDFDDLPTGGIAHLGRTAEYWRNVASRNGKLLRFTFPKEKQPD